MERGIFGRFMNSLMPEPESIEDILDRAKGGYGGAISSRIADRKDNLNSYNGGPTRINMS